MQGKILCMYSGGLDSAGSLWSILCDPKYAGYQVHVHHIHNINHENRAQIESIVVEHTLPVFERLSGRSFIFSQNRIDFSCLPFPSNIPFDTDIFAFMSGNLAAIDPAIQYVAIGRTRDDVIGGGINTANQILRARDTFNLLKGTESQATYLLPVEHMSKQQIWDMLPHEIREKTWSCRRPVYETINGQPCIRPCQSCKSCVSRNALVSK